MRASVADTKLFSPSKFEVDKSTIIGFRKNTPSTLSESNHSTEEHDCFDTNPTRGDESTVYAEFSEEWKC